MFLQISEYVFSQETTCSKSTNEILSSDVYPKIKNKDTIVTSMMSLFLLLTMYFYLTDLQPVYTVEPLLNTFLVFWVNIIYDQGNNELAYTMLLFSLNGRVWLNLANLYQTSDNKVVSFGKFCICSI